MLWVCRGLGYVGHGNWRRELIVYELYRAYIGFIRGLLVVKEPKNIQHIPKGSMYPNSIYLSLKVVSILVVWGQSIYSLGTWILWDKGQIASSTPHEGLRVLGFCTLCSRHVLQMICVPFCGALDKLSSGSPKFLQHLITVCSSLRCPITASESPYTSFKRHCRDLDTSLPSLVVRLTLTPTPISVIKAPYFLSTKPPTTTRHHPRFGARARHQPTLDTNGLRCSALFFGVFCLRELTRARKTNCFQGSKGSTGVITSTCCFLGFWATFKLKS